MFVRDSGRPVPETLQVCFSCEQAHDAIAGLQEAEAGKFVLDDELEDALGVGRKSGPDV